MSKPNDATVRERYEYHLRWPQDEARNLRARAAKIRRMLGTLKNQDWIYAEGHRRMIEGLEASAAIFDQLAVREYPPDVGPHEQ